MDGRKSPFRLREGSAVGQCASSGFADPRPLAQAGGEK